MDSLAALLVIPVFFGCLFLYLVMCLIKRYQNNRSQYPHPHIPLEPVGGPSGDDDGRLGEQNPPPTPHVNPPSNAQAAVNRSSPVTPLAEGSSTNRNGAATGNVCPATGNETPQSHPIGPRESGAQVARNGQTNNQAQAIRTNNNASRDMGARINATERLANDARRANPPNADHNARRTTSRSRDVSRGRTTEANRGPNRGAARTDAQAEVSAQSTPARAESRRRSGSENRAARQSGGQRQNTRARSSSNRPEAGVRFTAESRYGLQGGRPQTPSQLPDFPESIPPRLGLTREALLAFQPARSTTSSTRAVYMDSIAPLSRIGHFFPEQETDYNPTRRSASTVPEPRPGILHSPQHRRRSSSRQNSSRRQTGAQATRGDQAHGSSHRPQATHGNEARRSSPRARGHTRRPSTRFIASGHRLHTATKRDGHLLGQRPRTATKRDGRLLGQRPHTATKRDGHLLGHRLHKTTKRAVHLLGQRLPTATNRAAHLLGHRLRSIDARARPDKGDALIELVGLHKRHQLHKLDRLRRPHRRDHTVAGFLFRTIIPRLRAMDQHQQVDVPRGGPEASLWSLDVVLWIVGSRGDAVGLRIRVADMFPRMIVSRVSNGRCGCGRG